MRTTIPLQKQGLKTAVTAGGKATTNPLQPKQPVYQRVKITSGGAFLGDSIDTDKPDESLETINQLRKKENKETLKDLKEKLDEVEASDQKTHEAKKKFSAAIDNAINSIDRKINISLGMFTSVSTVDLDDALKTIAHLKQEKDETSLKKLHQGLENKLPDPMNSDDPIRDRNLYIILSETKKAIINIEHTPKKEGQLSKNDWYKLFIDKSVSEAKEGLAFDYENSPGYYNAMMHMFENVVDKKEKMSADKYNKYHKEIKKRVVDGMVDPHGKEKFYMIQSGWSDKGVEFDMNIGKVEPTPPALLELIDEGIIDIEDKNGLLAKKYPAFSYNSNGNAYVTVSVISKSNESTDELLFSCRPKYSGVNAPQIIETIFSSYYEKIKILGDFYNEDGKEYDYFVNQREEERPGKEASLREYRKEVIKTTAKVVRNLHVGHFFPDANGRINIMILLNKFLLENDLSPVILNTPAVFGGALTLEQLEREIEIGMKNFEVATTGLQNIK